MLKTKMYLYLCMFMYHVFVHVHGLQCIAKDSLSHFFICSVSNNHNCAIEKGAREYSVK